MRGEDNSAKGVAKAVLSQTSTGHRRVKEGVSLLHGGSRGEERQEGAGCSTTCAGRQQNLDEDYCACSVKLNLPRVALARSASKLGRFCAP